MGQSQSKGTAFQSLDVGRIADPTYVKTQFLKHWRLHSGADSPSEESRLHRIGLHSITVCADRINERANKWNLLGENTIEIKEPPKQINSMRDDRSFLQKLKQNRQRHRWTHMHTYSNWSVHAAFVYIFVQDVTDWSSRQLFILNAIFEEAKQFQANITSKSRSEMQTTVLFSPAPCAHVNCSNKFRKENIHL